MKLLLREPLLHFLLLGAMIFAAYGLTTRAAGDTQGKIVVTQGQIASIGEGFVRTRQRAPTPEELQGLIRDRVREEIYYREALALGLDKDDVIVRRRLQQKMEFVSDGLAPSTEPSDAELQAYLNAHAAEFATEPRFSFRQVYLDPQRHGASLARDAERLRASLDQSAATGKSASLGDPILLEPGYDNVADREVANMFGDKFAAALGTLPVGRWQGPVESGYGVHVVFLAERKGGGTPALADVREVVRREWTSARQRELAAKSYEALLHKYAVVIEAPSAASATLDPVASR